jgi:Methyltransferase domain
LALPENYFDLWHDRAVFHFLTERKDRELYLKNLRQSLKNNGHLIIAAFSEDGALKCSGLDVERYSLEKMQKTLGADFKLLQSFREEHRTPFNTTQSFIYAHFQIEK